MYTIVHSFPDLIFVVSIVFNKRKQAFYAEEVFFIDFFKRIPSFSPKTIGGFV